MMLKLTGGTTEDAAVAACDSAEVREEVRDQLVAINLAAGMDDDLAYDIATFGVKEMSAIDVYEMRMELAHAT